MIIPGTSFLLVFCQNPILHSEAVHIYVFNSVKPGSAFKCILIIKPFSRIVKTSFLSCSCFSVCKKYYINIACLLTHI